VYNLRPISELDHGCQTMDFLITLIVAINFFIAFQYIL